MQRLKDKSAIVTGAGSGIGRAIAVRLASEGANVGVLDLAEESARETATIIARDGGSAHAIACDVTDASSIENALDESESKCGPLDIAVNNAGVAAIGSLLETTEEDFDRVFSVNCRGVFLCLKAEVSRMQDRGGAIVNLGSIAGDLGIPDRFAYSATKGAVHMMTRAVACDFVKSGIRCNAIAPARVHTPFVDGFLADNYPGQEKEIFAKLSAAQPIGRMGRPEEIAALAAYLCSEESSFVTGAVFPIDGGFSDLRI